MNNQPDRPANPWASGSPDDRLTADRNRPRMIAIGVCVLVVVLCVAVGAWFLGRNSSGEDAASATSATTGSTGQGTPEVTASSTVTTVTVAPEAAQESSQGTEPESAATRRTPTAVATPVGAAESVAGDSGNSGRGSGPLACDGRGVLIVNSIYSDSPSFQREVDASLAQNPGSVLLDPGTCPSLRPHHNGADVYAVVVDYGDDLASLCTAERNGGGNARLLDSDTSYRSPC